MKKRSLFSRVLSGLAAAALAATVCFGDGIFRNLAVSAADDPVVSVGFYDGGEKSPVVNEEDDTNTYRYFVLGALIKNENAQYVDPKDGKTKNRTATAEHVRFIEAWDCIELDKAESEQTVTFKTFYQKHANYTQNYDRQQPKVAYDTSKYTFVSRVYRYWVTKDDPYNPGADPQPTDNPHATAGVEPTNLIAPEGDFTVQGQWGNPDITYHEQSADNIPGYVPSSTTQGNVTNVRFDKQNVEFYVDVNFSKATTIAKDEYLYVVVETEHANHSHSYYYQQLVADKETNQIELIVQDKDNHHWRKTTSGEEDPHEHYHGNEPSTTIRLFKASAECNLDNLFRGENCSELKTGDYVKTQKVNIKGQVKEGDEVTTKFYEVINLEAASTPDNYTYTDILGSGVAFGITADRFALKGHMQTNLAVNYFRDTKNGQNFECDLSEPSAGDHFIAYFATLSDPTDISDNPDGTITIGNTKKPGVMHVDIDNINRVKFTGGGGQWFGTLSETSMPAAQIKNGVVDPAIAQMQAMSNLLASKPANITPYLSGDKYVIDTREYPDGATIYVDADALIDAKSRKCDVEFFKKENHTIVLNVTKSKNILIDSYKVHYLREGSETLETINSATSDGLDIDEQVMRKIVWNLNSCYNTADEFKANTDPCVEMKNTAGTFLIPNATTATHMTGTTSGWIMTAGYFENTEGEWHFPYHLMDKYKAPKNTSINISKRAIVGDGELEGATIQIYDKVKGKNIGDAVWKEVIKQNGGVDALTDDIGGLKDVTYGMQWTSGDVEKTVVLRDGSYTLKETGGTFTSGGKTYSVVSSSVDFEILNGAIKTAPKDVTEKNGGSIKYDADSNTIVIRDAQVGGPVSYPVHINKTDVTGENELAGAKLTVYSVGADGKETIVSDTNNPWISKIGAELTLALVPGNYVLRETAATDKEGKPVDITDKDGKTYQVSVSEVAFTVGDDGKVTSSSAVASARQIDKEKGGVILNNNKEGDAVLTICDASNKTDVTINKTDINGQEELIGAQLTIYEFDESKTDGKGAKVGETWTSKAGEKMTVTLEDGTYVLEETAAEGTSVHGADGKTYKVIPSTVKFTVKNGTVASDDTVSKVSDVDKTNGGAVLSGTEFTICDAANTTNVIINKTDITGQQELIGAQLKIFEYDEKAQDHKGAQVGKTWTSKAGEKMSVTLEDGKYVLEETAAEDAPVHDADGKTYKVIPSTVEFAVSNGTVTSTDAVSKFDDVDKTNGGAVLTRNELTVCDVANTTKVTLNKTDINGQQELIGAQLTIYKYDSSKADGKGDKVGSTWTSKAGEKMTVSLEDGKYVLEETAASDAPVHDAGGKTYKVIPSTVSFTVSNGTVTSTDTVSKVSDVDKTTGGAVLSGTEFTICDAAATTNVVINKKDITGEKELIGAQLNVYKYDENAEGHKGEQIGNTWTSDVDKTLSLTLEDGKYVLEETAAKDAQGKPKPITDAQGNKYKVIPSTVEFTVSNGTVSSADAVSKVDDVDKTTGGVVLSKNEMTICDAVVPKYPVVINKTDVTGEDELTGATLTVYDKDGKKVADWQSKPNEKMQLSLEDGEYTLKETGDDVHDDKGNQYKVITSEIKFTVTNGVVTSTGSKTEYTDVDTENGGVVIKNGNEMTICDAVIPKSEVTINKVDITGEEELNGAKLTVYKYDSSKPDGKGDKVGETWTSEAGKTLKLSLEDGDYVLEEKGDEIVDSKGNTYKVLPADTRFSVKDGKVVPNGKDFKDLDQTVGGLVIKGNTVYVSDAVKTVKVTIAKTDITEKAEITGAMLQIYDADGKAVFDKPWVSGTDGDKWEVSLAPGEYTLKESPASVVTDAKGNTYQVITSEYKFKIGTDGKVTETAPVSSDEGSIALRDGNVIKVVDALTPPETIYVHINKTDITGQKELANATLTVYKKDADGKLVQVKDANNPWVSKIGAELTLALEDGDYVLVETATQQGGKTLDIVDEDGRTYQVSVSSVEFTIKDGKVTCTTAEDSFDKIGKNGGVVQTAKNNEAVLTICDAANTTAVKLNKTNITGDKELIGAYLTIYEYKEDAQGHKGAKVGDSWQSNINSKFEVSLPDGKYVLEETGDKVTDDENNTYKVLTSRFEFTVSKGTVTAVSKAEADFLPASDTGYYVLKGNEVTVCDVMVTKHYVHINKTDISGKKELAGATLTILDAQTLQPVADANNPWESKEGSTLNICLEDGNYILRETGTDIHDADGVKYNVYSSDIAFTVTNGVVTATGAKSDFDEKASAEYVVVKYADGDSFLTVCDAMRTTKVTFNKTDITGQNELIGAQLTVYKYDADAQGHKGAKVGTWTSDINKTAQFDLPDGKFVLEETPAKDAQGKDVTIVDAQGKTYKVLTSTVEFTVADGKVTSADAVSKVSDVDKTAGGAVLTENQFTICDAANTAQITLNKTDITGKKELSGATLQISKDGKVVDEWISEEGKTKTFTLEDGEYVLTEKATVKDGKTIDVTDSDGKTYKVTDSTVTFTVAGGKVTKQTGAVSSRDELGGKDGVINDGNTFVVSDAATTTPVVLNKKNISGDEELAGARLAIKQGNNELYSWTSVIGETKTFELEDGDYTLVETGDKVVDEEGREYTVMDTTLDFTVANGKVTASAAKKAINPDASEGYFVLPDDSANITVCDAAAKTTIILNKTDVTGNKELAGATLTISDKDGKQVASWVSVIGKTFEFDLADGEYVLEESGDKVTDEDDVEYNVLNTKTSFTVKGGKISSKTVKNDFDEKATTCYVVIKNDVELTVCDIAKSHSSDTSSGGGSGKVSTDESGSQQSGSVSTPASSSESQQSGKVSTDESGSQPSGSVSTPASSSGTNPSASTPASSSVKPASSSGSKASTSGTKNTSGSTKKTSGQSTSGSKTSSSTNGSTNTNNTTSTGPNGNPPQTGHAGSTVTVAALLAAVAALAVLKKKND